MMQYIANIAEVRWIWDKTNEIEVFIPYNCRATKKTHIYTKILLIFHMRRRLFYFIFRKISCRNCLSDIRN